MRAAESIRPSRVERFADRSTAERLAVFMSRFANPLRLRLLCRLMCGGRLTVNELAEWAGESQSAVSRQLKLLWTARLLDPEKVGTNAFYTVADPAAVETMEFVASLSDRVRQPRGWASTPPTPPR